MSNTNIKSITLIPMDLPPGHSPEQHYATDGKIEFVNGQEYFFPFLAQREGRTIADLELAARNYLAAKGNEMYPYVEPEPPADLGEA
ncbi:hypothetical protein D3C87_1190660 [compost metagenome]